MFFDVLVFSSPRLPPQDLEDPPLPFDSACSRCEVREGRCEPRRWGRKDVGGPRNETQKKCDDTKLVQQKCNTGVGFGWIWVQPSNFGEGLFAHSCSGLSGIRFLATQFLRRG